MADYMFAYATNISETEMHSHCPNAIFRGFGVLEGFTLDFCGYTGHAVANLRKQKGANINVAVWEMSPEDYYTIDNFEKFPYLYKREKASVLLYGSKVKGNVYVLKQQLQSSMPSDEYLNFLKNTYADANIDQSVIDKAIQRITQTEEKA